MHTNLPALGKRQQPKSNNKRIKKQADYSDLFVSLSDVCTCPLEKQRQRQKKTKNHNASKKQADYSDLFVSLSDVYTCQFEKQRQQQKSNNKQIKKTGGLLGPVCEPVRRLHLLARPRGRDSGRRQAEGGRQPGALLNCWGIRVGGWGFGV